MKYHTKARRAVLIASLPVIVLISIIGINRAPAQISGPQERVGNDFREIRDALRRGGVREAAKLKGHYAGDFDAHWDMGLFDIEALTKNSLAVVVGTVVKKLSGRLTAGGQLIFTDYEVLLDETIKGDLTKGSTITIALPGGRVEFEDGTSAELRMPEFEHVKIGGGYTLFLTEGAEAPNGYTLTGGPQGLVEIMSDGTPKSHGRPTDPIALETKDPNKGKNKDTFIKEVRKEAVKWPGPGKCCS